jgi:hypothetical protein
MDILGSPACARQPIVASPPAPVADRAAKSARRGTRSSSTNAQESGLLCSYINGRPGLLFFVQNYLGVFFTNHRSEPKCC